MEVTWTDILIKLVEILFYAVVTIGIPYLASLASKYVKNSQAQKLLGYAQGTVEKVVLMVNQTFVDQLKKDGAFNYKEQKEAFARARAEIIKMLSEEAKLAIIEQVGDLEAWLETQIEAAVKEGK